MSTLIAPLALAGGGVNVPKISVPGRPAGGIDVLSAIPGYNSDLDGDEFEAAIKCCGYAHSRANDTWAPADAALFRLRSQEGTKSIPALAVASLLSKKLSAGVTYAGLEARVSPHGNFGVTPGQAREAADLYCEVALLLEMVPIVFITDATVPHQPHIGRGEALTGMWSLLNELPADPWSLRHMRLCESMAYAMLEVMAPPGQVLDPLPGVEAMARAMRANLEAQGSDEDRWRTKVQAVATQPTTVAAAPVTGYVHYRLDVLRDLVTGLQAGNRGDIHVAAVSAHAPDEFGCTLTAEPGRVVSRGDPVLQARSGGSFDASVLYSCFDVLDCPSTNDNTLLETVTA